MVTCQADAHYLHMELESSLSNQMDRPKLKKTRMQNCVGKYISSDPDGDKEMLASYW
jgi:hypothetical protein